MDYEVQLDSNSRYQFADLYRQDDKQLVWSTRQSVENPSRPDDIFVDVREGDRIDMISYRVYGDPALWWIIADYNTLPFPMALQAGTTLRMPSREVVEMEILNV